MPRQDDETMVEVTHWTHGKPITEWIESAVFERPTLRMDDVQLAKAIMFANR